MREKDESWGKKSTTAYSCYLLTPQVLRFQACAMMPSNRGTKSTHHPALSQFTCFLSRAYWSTRSIPPTDIDKFLFLAFASFIASVFDDPATSFRARYRPRPTVTACNSIVVPVSTAIRFSYSFDIIYSQLIPFTSRSP